MTRCSSQKNLGSMTRLMILMDLMSFVLALP